MFRVISLASASALYVTEQLYCGTTTGINWGSCSSGDILSVVVGGSGGRYM